MSTGNLMSKLYTIGINKTNLANFEYNVIINI